MLNQPCARPGEHDGYGTSVDLWALGTLAYHWTTGKRPFVPADETSSSDAVKGRVRAGQCATRSAMCVLPSAVLGHHCARARPAIAPTWLS
jgi:hypothetical protein